MRRIAADAEDLFRNLLRQMSKHLLQAQILRVKLFFCKLPLGLLLHEFCLHGL